MITVSGALETSAEYRVWMNRPTVFLRIHGGNGLPFEARIVCDDAHAAERLAERYSRGAFVSVEAPTALPRTDHSYAAIILNAARLVAP